MYLYDSSDVYYQNVIQITVAKAPDLAVTVTSFF